MKKRIKKWLDINTDNKNISRELTSIREEVIFLHKLIIKFSEESKKKYAWELREEEISDIVDGKKFKKIRKILE